MKSPKLLFEPLRIARRPQNKILYWKTSGNWQPSKLRRSRWWNKQPLRCTTAQHHQTMLRAVISHSRSLAKFKLSIKIQQ